MIETLELKNFKGYKYEKINFSKINLLTGTNSSGKSTIIQSLKLFEFTNNENIKKYPSRQKNEISIVDLSQDKDSNFIGFRELKRKRSLLSNVEDDEDIVTFSITIDGVEKEYDEVSFYDDEVKNNLSSVKYTSLEEKKLLFVHADRFYLSDQYQSSYYDSYIPKNNNSSIADYIYDHSLTLKNSIKDRLSDVLKDIGLIKKEIDVEKKYNSYTVTIDGNPIEHVGSGIRYTIPIILTALTNKSATICIENPELHLHPKAQTKLIEFLVNEAINKDNQLIIETHSDHIINAICVLVKELQDLDNSDIETLFIKDQKITKIPLDSNGKFELYINDFFDEYENQLEKLVW